MGAAGSAVYGHVKRFAYRYNVEFRSQKFIEKEKLPQAPRHPSSIRIDINKILKDDPALQKEIEELNIKNEQLNEHLKKVYLTSNKVEEVKSTRPLPVKTEAPKTLFYEPETPTIGNITLTQFVKLLLDYQNDPKKWTVPALANQYGLNNTDVVNLLMYYTLFRQEKYDFMRADAAVQDESESKPVEFEVYKRKNLKQIQDK